MKYLKVYKLFESNSIQDIISDIKDMLVEIEDIGGIAVDCREFKPFNYHKTKAAGKQVFDSEIKVWIKPIDTWKIAAFEISDEVIDIFRRIIDYMKSQHWTHTVTILDDGYENKKMDLDEIDRMSIWPGETFGISFRKSESKSDTLKIPDGWSEIENSLVKDFKFESFRKAKEFVNKVADLAESQNHHPQIEWTYNVVKLSLSTHDAGDIFTNKDIKLASDINGII